MSHSSVLNMPPYQGSAAEGSVGSATADLIESAYLWQQSVDWESLLQEEHNEALMNINDEEESLELSSPFAPSSSHFDALGAADMEIDGGNEWTPSQDAPVEPHLQPHLTRGILRKVRARDELEWHREKKRPRADVAGPSSMAGLPHSNFENALWRETGRLPEIAQTGPYFPRPPPLPRRPKRKAVRGRRTFPGCRMELPPQPDEIAFTESWNLGVAPFYYEPPLDQDGDHYPLPGNVSVTTDARVELSWHEEARPGDFFYRSGYKFVRIRNPDPASLKAMILRHCPCLLDIHTDLTLLVQGKMPWHEGDTL